MDFKCNREKVSNKLVNFKERWGELFKNLVNTSLIAYR